MAIKFGNVRNEVAMPRGIGFVRELNFWGWLKFLIEGKSGEQVLYLQCVVEPLGESTIPVEVSLKAWRGLDQLEGSESGSHT